MVDRSQARLAPGMREALLAAGARWPVAIVTGRQLGTIQDLMGLTTLTVAASHGFQLWMPGRGLLPGPAVDLEALARAEAELDAAARGLQGVEVERKPYSVAVHHRRASAEAAEAMRRRVADVVQSSNGALRATLGRRVWELQPDIERNKGWAVRRLLEELDASVYPVSLGDDVTDEDAFRAVEGRGVGILVRSPERADIPTAATLALDGVGEVEIFLRALAQR